MAKITAQKKLFENTRRDYFELIAVLLISCFSESAFHVRENLPMTEMNLRSLIFAIPKLIGLAYVIWILLSHDGLWPTSPLNPANQSAVSPSKKASKPRWTYYGARILSEVIVGCLIGSFIWMSNRLANHILTDAGMPKGELFYAASYFKGIVADPLKLAAYIIYMLIGAIYEEIVFRAYFIHKFRKILGEMKYAYAAPIVVSAALFAAKHGYSARSTIIVFVSGLFFGVTYLRTQSLRTVIVAHWLLDVIILGEYL